MGLLEEIAAQKRRAEFVDALYLATLNGDLERARAVLEPQLTTGAPAGEDDENASEIEVPEWSFEDAFGWTPLHCAAAQGSSELVTLFLDAGLPVDIWHKKNAQRALHRASDEGHAGVISLLVERGAAVNAIGIDGATALHHACAAGHVEAIRALLTCEGIRVNARTLHRHTPLMAAAMRGHDAAIRELLSDGRARIDARDQNGWSALHHAVSAPERALEAAAELIRAGADRSLQSIGSRPVFAVGAGQALLSAVDELLAAEAAAAAPEAAPEAAS